MTISPFCDGNVMSLSVPIPWTSRLRNKRIKTVVSGSGESIILALPPVSLRFCRSSGKDERKEDR